MDAQQAVWLKTHTITVCPPGPFVPTFFQRVGREIPMAEIIAKAGVCDNRNAEQEAWSEQIKRRTAASAARRRGVRLRRAA